MKGKGAECMKINYEKMIELDNVTLKDCIDLYKKQSIVTEINDGRVTNLIKEK